MIFEETQGWETTKGWGQEVFEATPQKSPMMFLSRPTSPQLQMAAHSFALEEDTMMRGCREPRRSEATMDPRRLRANPRTIVQRTTSGNGLAGPCTEAPRHQQIAWGKQITWLHSNVEAILALVDRDGALFSARNLATSAHRIGKFGDARRVRADPRLERLSELCRFRLSRFEPQHIANSAWGFAKTGSTKRRLFEAIAAEVPRRVVDFNSQELANTAWAFATSGVAAPHLFEAIAAEATSRISEFNAQGIANTAWAFATARVPAARLFEAIAEEAPSRIDEFNSQNVANTAWAFATAADLCGGGQGQQKKGIFQARQRRLFEAIAYKASRRIRDFNSQDMANTAWAFARAGVAALDLFDAIASAAPRRIAEFKSQELANTAWAFAAVDVAAPMLFAAIAAETPRRIDEFNSQDLSNAAWAFAKAGLGDLWFYEAVAAKAAAKMSDFSVQGLCDTAWAFATAGVSAPRLFEAIARETSGRIGEFTSQELLTKMAWAFACVGWDQRDFFSLLGSALHLEATDLSEIEQSQLYLVALYVQSTWPDLTDSPLTVHLHSLRSAHTRKRHQTSFFSQQPQNLVAGGESKNNGFTVRVGAPPVANHFRPREDWHQPPPPALLHNNFTSPSFDWHYQSSEAITENSKLARISAYVESSTTDALHALVA